MIRIVFVCLVACNVLCARAAAQPLTAVVSDPTNFQVRLDPVVNLGAGLVPIDAAAVAGDTSLYVGTYLANTASVRVVDPLTSSVSATPFLTFSGTGVPIAGQGLQGITFSPNFNDDSQPGYRKFYTFEAETGPGGANVMFLHPEVSNPGTVGVLREWTANAAGTAVDASVPSRVVFNYGTPGGHMGGGLKFGPDGYLYLATGDGGGNGNGGSTSNNTDGFTGRNPSGSSSDVPGISNGQDFTNVLGKVIRIDPYVTGADGSPRETPAGATAKDFGGSTRYFIPDDNPFVGNPQNAYFTPIGPVGSESPEAPLAELYAIGFRNPWKLSFDQDAAPGEAPYVADVGSHVREEIIQVEPGRNYAWPYREGDIASGAAGGRPLESGNVPYLKETAPGVYEQFDLDPTFSDPSQMPLPIALLGTQSISGGQFWDRPGQDYFNDGIYGDEWGDTNTVTGGFVYRGSEIPELEGMYVFGGYQFLQRANSNNYQPESLGGRLFYFDPDEEGTYKTVREFNFQAGFDIPDNGSGDLLSVSQGADGELYAMFVNGDIKQISTVPGVTYYWDTNGTSSGLGSAASPANWLTNSWATSPSGTDPTGPWPNNPAANNRDQAVFAGTAGTVTVNDDVYVGGLRFETSGYVINSSDGALHLTGPNPTIDVSLPNNNNTATISAPIVGGAGLKVTGNTSLGAGRLTFLVLANTSDTTPNAFSGLLTVEADGALRLGGGVDHEQIPDDVDMSVEGVVDFITSGGASDGKRERVRNVTVAGTQAIFSVGNGSDFEMNSLSAEQTSTGPGVSVNGNNASVPGTLSITGWADGAGNLSLDESLLRVNTTGAQSAIGGRILLAGNIQSSGNSEVSNKNGGSTPDDNNFAHKAFDFTGAAHAIDVVDGTLTFTSTTAVHPLEVTSTNPEGTTLTKTGAGVWLLEHAVQTEFTGTTHVADGVLRLAAAERLADEANLSVSTGATVDLAFSLGSMETVNALLFDGVSQPVGTWGSSASGAMHVNDDLFTGLGMLNVLQQIFPPLLGDYNEDGVVNAADYVVWRNHNGTAFNLPNRDSSQSGDIGPGDYDIWVGNYGERLEAGNSHELAVPEPAMGTLLAVLVGCANSVRRRPRRK